MGFVGSVIRGWMMKARKEDATHWQSKHKEHWLRENGCWYLFCNGYWQRAKPDFNGMVKK